MSETTSKNIVKGRQIDLDVDPTLSADSDEIVPSQKAIKTYIDSELAKGTYHRWKGAD